jgi:8-oxo-dGTP pyrophosphatase MutT (NUDIX family)
VTEYVAGLLFSDEGDRVTLIRKLRPEWQAGCYNAVGGKVEFGEVPAEAMQREFIEEAGVNIEWDFRFTLREEGVFAVHFFSCFNSEAMTHLQTMTDEVIEVVDTYDLPEDLIPNLWWIIPMLNDSSSPILPQDILVGPTG